MSTVGRARAGPARRQGPAPAAASAQSTPRPDGDHEVVDQLQALSAALPALAWRGVCAHSRASPVDASTAGRERIAAVHRIRPTICRLWGTTASMPCPHGWTPNGGVLDDATAMALLAASLDAGGHRDSGLRELLAGCVADREAGALMAARLRGHRAVEPALATRLRQLSGQRC